MSSTIKSFLDETRDLPPSQQIERYTQWLRDNPSDFATIFIQDSLNKAIQLNIRDEALAKKDEALAKKDEEHAIQINIKDKELAETVEALAKKDEEHAIELAKKDEEHAIELAEKDEKLAKRSLSSLRTKYPAQTDTTDSGAHLSEKHHHADVHEVDTRRALQSVQENWLDEQFWTTAFFRDPDFKNCSCETSVQSMVVLLLQSILIGLGLHKYVDVLEHRTLAGSECDVLLVYRANFLPFAVLEVKKPCNSIEERRSVWLGEKIDSTEERSNVVAGQIFDAMTSLKLYGFPQVYGMITTWNHWRLVGTSTNRRQVKKIFSKATESKEFLPNIQQRFKGQVQSDHSVMNAKNSPEQPNVVLQEVKQPKKKSSIEKVIEVSGKSRFVWASNIVPSFENIVTSFENVTSQEMSLEDTILHQVKTSGTSIVSLVTLFVVKSCKMLLDFLQANDPSTLRESIIIRRPTPCRVLKKNEHVFAFKTITLDEINLNYFNPNVQTLHVIQHLGMGAHGNCCLAVSSSECRVLKVAEGYCLVMPYLHPIPESQRRIRIEDQSIYKGLQLFARSGFVHPEIQWRHIGLKIDRVGEKVALLDFGRLVEEPDEKKRAAWCDNAIKTLCERANLVVDETPKKKAAKRQKT